MTHREKAIDLFCSGYNCAQAVFCAYSEDLNIDMATARNMAMDTDTAMDTAMVLKQRTKRNKLLTLTKKAGANICSCFLFLKGFNFSDNKKCSLVILIY